MSRLRAMAARLRAASVYVQLCLMACRDRLVRLLLLLPVMLLPHTAMAKPSPPGVFPASRCQSPA